MICPFCKKDDTSVVDSRPTEDGSTIRRRRLCNCGERFTTFERVQFRELTVIKKNGRKSVFDREKLSKSIYIALKKRPIDTDTAEKFISNISNRNNYYRKNTSLNIIRFIEKVFSERSIKEIITKKSNLLYD